MGETKPSGHPAHSTLQRAKPARLPVTAVSLLWHVSRKEFASHPVRIALFIVAVALGVSLPTSMHIATNSVVAEFDQSIARPSGSVDLQVTFGSGELGFPERLVEIVRATPGVAYASALVRGSARILAEPQDAVELVGVDLMQADLESAYGVRTVARAADDFSILNDPTALIVTRRLAHDYGLALGSALRLSAPAGIEQFTVRAIVDTRGAALPYEGRIVFAFLPVAQTALGKSTDETTSNVDQIDVVLSPGAQATAVRQEIERRLPAGFTVAPPFERVATGARLTAGLRATLMGISVFALLAATFLVYSTTSALIGYRMPTLASLVTLGVMPETLVRLVACEAAFLGAIGSLLGGALGLVLARFAVADVAAGMSLNYAVAFSAVAPPWLPGTAALTFVPVGVLATILSAWIPASRLRLLDPIALERSHGATPAGVPQHSTVLYVVGTLCAATGAAGIWWGASRQATQASATGSALSGVALVLLTLPIARELWQHLGAPLSRAIGVSGWFASEQVQAASERTMANVAAIALVIGVALTAATLPHSFRRSVAQWYGFHGDLILASRTRQGGWLSAPTGAEIIGRLEDLREVASVDAVRVAPGLTYAGDRLMVVGMTSGYLRAALEGVPPTRREEILRVLAADQGVIVSENLSAHYGVSVGDTLDLESPTGSLHRPVVAVVPDFSSDKGSVLLARNVFMRHWNDDLVNYVAIEAAPGVSSDALHRAVARALAAAEVDLTMFTPAGFRSRIDRAITQAFADVDALRLLVLLVTVAGVLDLLISNVLDRRRLYAALRAVGMLDRTLFGLVAVEASIISGTAAVLGGLIGGVASWIWIRFTYPVLVGYTLRLHFAWESAGVCALLTIATAIVAGVAAVAAELRRHLGESLRAA